MSRLRLFVYLVFGLLLCAVSVSSRAETIPATPTAKLCSAGQSYKMVANGHEYCSSAAICTGEKGAGVLSGASNSVTCSDAARTVIPFVVVNDVPGYICPSGQNWTLNGSICTRPDCVAPATRQPDGTCGSPCLAKKGQWSEGYVDTAVNAAAPTGSFCKGSCEVTRTLQIGPEMLVGKGKEWWPMSETYTGNSCSGADTATDFQNADKAPPKPQKDAPCATGEGVMTSSSGKVSCVPPGNPDASTPTVKKETKTDTFPDGTTKTTTTTTTTDPNTGATAQTVSSTSTGGQSGTAGTTTSKSNSGGTDANGDGNGDGDGDGDCDPTLNFCGGPATEGIYTKKEKTFSSVLDQFQNTVKGSSIGSATTQFFNVNTPSGGCPGWVVTVPYINYTISGAEVFCNGSLLSVLHGAGAVMLALATYIAFTWAFL